MPFPVIAVLKNNQQSKRKNECVRTLQNIVIIFWLNHLTQDEQCATLLKLRLNAWGVCLAGLGRSWSVEIPEIEKVAWIWCLFLAFTVPEVGTFIRSARLCFFKVSHQDYVTYVTCITMTDVFPFCDVFLRVKNNCMAR